MELRGSGERTFYLNNVEWGMVLGSVVFYEWAPKDTVLKLGPNDRRSSGPCIGLGQQITESDASRLADALESWRLDIPNYYVLERRWIEFETEEYGDVTGIPTKHITPTEWFSGSGKHIINALANFCREGGFTITDDAPQPV